jgi:hypothetical protein
MQTPLFRLWLQKKWFEHTDELDSIGLPVNYTSADYFKKYKYWLKREYRHQMKASDV